MGWQGHDNEGDIVGIPNTVPQLSAADWEYLEKLEQSKALVVPDDFEDTHIENNDVEVVDVLGRSFPTDLCYTLDCPDVTIAIKQMGKKTSIRIESKTTFPGEDDLFLEARCNTIVDNDTLEKAIIKIKLAFDIFYRGKYEQAGV